jgi:cryptochrome
MRTILWFRKGLRLHDNPTLAAAIASGCTHLYPVFCLDPWFVGSGTVGANRLHFLLQSLADLDASLRALDSRLIVLRGNPTTMLPLAIKEWQIDRLCHEVDTEEYAKTRDAEVAKLCSSAGVEVVTRWGHTLCDLDALLKRHPGGTPTTTYSAFCNHLDKQLKAEPLKLLDAPSRVPPVGPLGALGASGQKVDVPTAVELSLPAQSSAVILAGGETEALRRMEAHLTRTDRDGRPWVASFEKPNTSPTEMDAFATGTRSTTVLSPYLKFGCLSSRVLHERIAAIYRKHPKHSTPPTSLHGQLYWREFYYTCAHGTPNFDRMEGNRICRQVPWDEDAELLAAWKEGRTGYPWIDAAMTQLREEGWIHHLARHAVACFLTRGDLWQSWEKGAEVFDELLLDADPAINRGNWMWLSCSCFFYQYFRCYSPVAFPQKYDKEGAYVRKWLPQLKSYPAKYIYEPWKAPIADQKKAGCVIGVDYPKPIVDHQSASKENMGRMAKAYEAHKAGVASGGGGGGGGGGSGGGGASAAADSGKAAGKAAGKRPLVQATLPAGKKAAASSASGSAEAASEASVLEHKETLESATASSQALRDALTQLSTMHCPREMLESTKIGVAVGKLRKHADAEVADLAASVVLAWKAGLSPPGKKQK